MRGIIFIFFTMCFFIDWLVCFSRSGELLGKGGFGTVRVVTHKATQNKYALKVSFCFFGLVSSHESSSSVTLAGFMRPDMKPAEGT